MKKISLFVCLLGAILFSSCSTKIACTSSVSAITTHVEQYPTVADLDINTTKVEKSITWNWSLFPEKYTLSDRKENLVAELLKEQSGDVLVEPEYIYSKKPYGPRSLTVIGYVAKFKNFRKATDEDIKALNAVNGLPRVKIVSKTKRFCLHK